MKLFHYPMFLWSCTHLPTPGWKRGWFRESWEEKQCQGPSQRCCRRTFEHGDSSFSVSMRDSFSATNFSIEEWTLNWLRDLFFFLCFHEMDSLRGDLLEWAGFFFLDFHEVFRVGTFAKRCDLESGFFRELFQDELFFRDGMRTNFFQFFPDEAFFFQDESFMERDDSGTHVRSILDSLFDFQPDATRQTLGRSFWQLLFTQVPKNCSFIWCDETLLLHMGNRWFSLRWDGDRDEDAFWSEVKTFSVVNVQ